MKKYINLSVISLLVAMSAAIYCGCANAPNNNSNANPAAIASPEPTPDKAAIEAELTRIENDWPRIIKERDAATVKQIEADDIALVYPDGSTGDKTQDMKDIGSGVLSFDAWEISDLTVRVIDPDSAIVTLRTTVKGGKYKLPDGSIQNISGQYRYIDTFIRRNGQWQMIGSASIKVANPVPSASVLPTPKALPSMKPSPVLRASPAQRPSPTARPSPRAVASPVKTQTP